jgi:hypothetical protein
MLNSIFNFVSADATTTIVGDLVVKDLDVLVKSQYYFFGIFLFLFVISILWKK